MVSTNLVRNLATVGVAAGGMAYRVQSVADIVPVDPPPSLQDHVVYVERPRLVFGFIFCMICTCVIYYRIKRGKKGARRTGGDDYRNVQPIPVPPYGSPQPRHSALTTPPRNAVLDTTVFVEQLRKGKISND
jgi:hypothetical protein